MMGELLRQVEARLAKHEAEAALDMLQQALAFYPSAWILRRALVFALLALGRGEETVQAAGRALDLQPMDAELWRLVAELTLQSNPEGASRAVRNALLFAPLDVRLQELAKASGHDSLLYSGLRLAWLHLYQGMYDLAAAELLEAEEEDALLARLGLMEVAWRRSSDLREAASIAKGLLQLKPHLLPAVAVLAADARQRGVAPEFEGWLGLLRDLDPDGSGTASCMREFLEAHPLPELRGQAVDLPVQEPLGREDLEVLQQLDQQLDVELMSLTVPEGHSLVDLEEVEAAVEEAEALASQALGQSQASEAAVELPTGGVEEQVVDARGAPPEPAEAGETASELAAPMEHERAGTGEEGTVPQTVAQIEEPEAELATVSELVRFGGFDLHRLGRRMWSCPAEELEGLVSYLRTAPEVPFEVRHRLLAMAYCRMGLGLEAAGEVVISLRQRRTVGPRK